MDNEKLSDKEYWEGIYRGGKGKGVSTVNRLLQWVRPEAMSAISDYSDYQLWEIFFKEFLPSSGENVKAIEIGCAPGDFLVKLALKYGYQPYGVEYTATGVDLAREVFRNNSLDENNIIHADFFSPEFLHKYRNHFDLVISRGFVEHFNDVSHVIGLHAELLKPGGTLVITIPRFKGANNLLMSFFNKDNLSIHNTEIMDESSFSAAFEGRGLIKKFCGRYGTINMKLFSVPDGSHKVHILRVLVLLQYVFNTLLYLVFRGRAMESYALSPYIAYIGIKKW
jgi:SAM-dependent methyltransferase